jgi:glutathione S-transferase
MITVFGEGRGFRVVWLLEEMGLAYRLRPVDLLAGVENDPECVRQKLPLACDCSR